MSGTGNELKRALRRAALERRAALDPAARAAASEAIAERVMALCAPAAVRQVTLFASVGEEIYTHELIARLIALKGALLLPRVRRADASGPKRLNFHRVTAFPEGHRPAFAGILEPDPEAYPEVVPAAGIDLMLVPGLLFDRRGYRIGYGGGFYDRYLSQPGRARAIGLSFAALFSDEPLPTDPWDVPLDGIITEHETIDSFLP